MKFNWKKKEIKLFCRYVSMVWGPGWLDLNDPHTCLTARFGCPRQRHPLLFLSLTFLSS